MLTKRGVAWSKIFNFCFYSGRRSIRVASLSCWVSKILLLVFDTQLGINLFNFLFISSILYISYCKYNYYYYYLPTTIDYPLSAEVFTLRKVMPRYTRVDWVFTLLVYAPILSHSIQPVSKTQNTWVNKKVGIEISFWPKTAPLLAVVFWKALPQSVIYYILLCGIQNYRLNTNTYHKISSKYAVIWIQSVLPYWLRYNTTIQELSQYQIKRGAKRVTFKPRAENIA